MATPRHDAADENDVHERLAKARGPGQKTAVGVATAYVLDAAHARAFETLGHPLRDRIQERIGAGDLFYSDVLIVDQALHLFGVQSHPPHYSTERVETTLRMLGVQPQPTRQTAEWDIKGSLFKIVETDAVDAAIAADIQAALRQQGRGIATVDALIAAVARRANLVLLTTDDDLTAVPSLQVENWI